MLARSSRYFYEPDSFHPERWLPADHALFDSRFASDTKQASRPFSTGPRNCVGMNLAYMEWRMLLARLAWRFDWELCSPDHGDLLAVSKLKLAWQIPPVRVRFVARSPN